MSSDSVHIEVKGAIMASEPRVKHAQEMGEIWLTELVGPDLAAGLIANRKKRDGERAHVTLVSPKDAKGKILDGATAVQSDWVSLGLGKAEANGRVAYFVVVSWPSGKEFRRSLGLDPDGQDFHITVGFGPEGDVHGVPKNVVL